MFFIVVSVQINPPRPIYTHRKYDEAIHVAVAAADPQLAERLTATLSREAIVSAPWDGQSAEADALVVDLSARAQALAALRRFRRMSDAPAVAVCGKDVDGVLALLTGADDYLSEPFIPGALARSLRATLKRRVRAASRATTTLRCGALIIDTTRRTATWRGAPIRLTAGEFAMLSALARRPGAALSREALLEAAGDSLGSMRGSTRAVDGHVKRMRRKFDADGGFDLIETLYGVGYRLRVQEGSVEQDELVRERRKHGGLHGLQGGGHRIGERR